MDLVLAVFATFALTTMLTDSEGPFEIFVKIRRLKYMTALKCFLCCSVWVGALTAITMDGNYLINWMAVAGASTALDYFLNG